MNALPRFLFISLLALATIFVPLARPDAPAWVMEAAKQPSPSLKGNPPAIVLLDENTVELNERGIAVVVQRVAIRILNTSGAEYASARVNYVDKSDRVRGVAAWVVRGVETVKTRNASEWTDFSRTSDATVFGDLRGKRVNLSEYATPGDVFAFESSAEQPLLIPQFRYFWGWNLPVVRESFRICIPKGLKIEPVFHGQPVPKSIVADDGRCTTWELRDQPYRPAEPFGPDLLYGCADLMLSIVPAEGAAPGFYRRFKTWGEVTDWADTLSAGQCDNNPALTDTVRRLTGECVDDLSKIRALGNYVQHLRYVALDTDLGKGAGYKPRKASQVFGQGYGDCKDKANLLQAMLKEVGISSFPVLAMVSSTREVWPDFPSPQQFDHAVLGIRVKDEIDFPAVITTAAGERILIFDPTNPFTQLGDLSLSLQGARVHLMTKGSDSLVVLPQIPGERGHLLERKAELKLAADGSVRGDVTIYGRGQEGARLRYGLFKATQPADLDALIASLLGDTIKGSQLQAAKSEDSLADDRCGVTFSFSHPHFLQKLPNAVSIARLNILARDAIPALSTKDRWSPVNLQPLVQADEIVLKLPDGFTVEELPAPLSLETPYGTYRRSCKAEGNTVVFTRRLEFKAQIVPQIDYAKLRSFLSDIGKAERAAILLKGNTS